MRITLILLIAVALSGCGSYDAGEAAPQDRTDAPAGSLEAPAAEEGPPTACKKNEDCEAAEYCAKVVGDCDGDGVCRAKPEICTRQWDPVCGCDDKTYSNACAAAAAGENVASKGECESE